MLLKKYIPTILFLSCIFASNSFATPNKNEIIRFMKMAFKQECLYLSDGLKKDITDCVEKAIAENPNAADDDIAHQCILEIALTSDNFIDLCM